MTTKYEDIFAMDFLIFMDQPESLDCIIHEYNTMELNRREFTSLEESEDKEPDEDGCLQFMCYLFHCMKNSEEKYPGAIFIDGYDDYDGQHKYICVKNPKAENCEKLLKVVWYQKIDTIVMISRQSDDKCYQYWNLTEGSETESGGYKIKTLKIITEPHYVLTVLCLSDHTNHERQISHYRYTGWPADNDSHDPNTFLSFVCSLNDIYANLKKKRPSGGKFGPVLVHCDDGLNTSAMYCILDICITQFKKTGTLSVAKTLEKMREQKYNCLNDLNDYTFCYRVLHKYVLQEMGMSQKID